MKTFLLGGRAWTRAGVFGAVAVASFILSACSDDPKAPAGAPDGGGGSGAQATGGRPGAGGSTSGGSANGGSTNGGSTNGGSANGGSASGGADGDGGSTPPDAGDAGDGAVGTSVGPAGGTVTGPGGAEVVIPGGALSQSVSIRIAEDATGAPSLPTGFAAIGPILAFTPHGTSFARPVTVTVPFDRALLPAGETPLLFKAEPGGAFAEVTSTESGDTVTASVSSFSWMVAARDIVQGGLRVVIDAEGDIQGRTVTTGVAGTVIVTGVTGADLDGSHPGGGSTCFVAKLTALLGFEWVRQFPSCFPAVGVGPTGNVYVVIESEPSPTATTIQLVSLNPSGADRAGFPVDIGPGIGGGATAFVRTLNVDGQDNVMVLGYQEATPFDARYVYSSRTFLASWSGSGQVIQARGFVDFGVTGPIYDFPWGLVSNTAGTWLTADWEERLSPSGTTRGYYVHKLTPSGPASGFPISVADTQTVLNSKPLVLGAIPGTEDVIGIGTARGAIQAPTLIRYQGTGSIAAGYPTDLVTGSSKTWASQFFSHEGFDVDGQGNVFTLGHIEDPATPNTPPDIVVLSYTTAGALRAGYPLKVGNEYSNQMPVEHDVSGLTVNDTGTMYLVGHDPHTSVAGRLSLMIHRLPAR